ncbi:hypothetical protein Acr_09g0001940 [Actinidia rufa]|uniref:Uncharacterized protein n=1 Tax=Actinidia rufa TaxID=165716 RepID=A0A7J0F4X7_9ERIC|nr:hypothetical protein Acr_09g0001940 [Actinidia rufa]
MRDLSVELKASGLIAGMGIHLDSTGFGSFPRIQRVLRFPPRGWAGLGWAAWLWAGWTEVGWTGLCRAGLHRLAGCGLGCTGWNGVELEGLCCTLHKPWLGCTVQRQGCVVRSRGCWWWGCVAAGQTGLRGCCLDYTRHRAAQGCAWLHGAGAGLLVVAVEAWAAGGGC